ncbi:MAG: energy transducer TonB [Bryobacteraceae bacterium]
MFETSVVGAGKTARPVTVSFSALAQVTLIAGGLLYFALRVEPLPKVQLRSWREAAQVVEVQRPRPTQPVAAPAEARLRVPGRPLDVTRFLARNTGPVHTDVDWQEPLVLIDPRIEGSSDPAVPSWAARSSQVPPRPVDPPKPVPAVVPPKAPAGPVTVGGDVRPPRLLREVKPVYPPLARQARIQGTVVIEAIISRDGAVRAARIASGHSLLVQAAIDAVRQWLYAPTMLNGQPVEVILMAEVNFKLSQ